MGEYVNATEHGRLHNKGKVKSAEFCRKDSISHKGLNTWMKGRRMKADTKMKISDAEKGSKNHFFGKHHTADANAKNAEAHKGTHRVYHEDGTFHMEKTLC